MSRVDEKDVQSAFHAFDAAQYVRIPEVIFEQRMGQLEGPSCQMWLARQSSASAEAEPRLVKLVDLPANQAADDEDAHALLVQRCQEFQTALASEVDSAFAIPDAQGVIAIEATNRRVLYQIISAVPAVASLQVGESADAADQAWWSNFRTESKTVVQALRRLTHAFKELTRHGYQPTSMTMRDVLFVDEGEGWLPKVIFDGSSFVAGDERDLASVPPRLQALHRIHPGLLGREPQGTDAAAVYTLGCLFFELLFNEHAYHRPGYSVVIERQLSLPDDWAANPLCALLHQMLDRTNPGIRPSFDRILDCLDESDATALVSALPVRAKRTEISVAEVRNISRPRAIFGLIRNLARVIGWSAVLLTPLGKRKALNEEQLHDLGRILAEFLQDFGALFVKLGQLLATRKDLIAEPIREELEKLKNENPEVPFEKIEALIRKDWGVEDVEEALLYLEAKPLGVASMGQVHRGRMRVLSNVDVAIKIRKPGIRKQLLRDLKWLKGAASVLDNIPVLKPYQLNELVTEFARSIEDELTFVAECRNLNEVAAYFDNDDEVQFPKVFLSQDVRRTLSKPSLTAEAEVMIMGFMAGAPVIDKDGLSRIGIRDKESRVKLARNIIRSFLRMVIVYGTYHADPHPGNVFGLPGCQVGWIDLGSVGRLTDRQKLNLFIMLKAITSQDAHLVVRVLQMMGALESGVATDRLEVDIKLLLASAHAMAKTGDTAAAFAQTLQEMTVVIQNHRVSVPPEMGLLFRAISEVEGTVSKLANDLDIAEELEREIMRVGLPIVLPEDLQMAVANRDWKGVMSHLPASLPARVLTGLAIDGYVFRHQMMKHQTRATRREKSDMTGPLFTIGLGCLAHWLYSPVGQSPAWWVMVPIAFGSIWGLGNLIRR
ncbi:MAG: AarF/UbiB family protein [Myxococcota bacterium]|nr:AarF/UbiB family protein [Myxococcota bacterium]